MYKKIFIVIALLFAINITSPKQTSASEKIAGASATLTAVIQKDELSFDMRVIAVENVFKHYNSILVPYARSYVKYADKFGVDWKLLPAISGLESYFATYYVPDTYNAYGWGGGYIYFQSWDDGIETINKALREKYMDRGADDVWKIGPIYAQSPTWSVRVNSFMREIDREYIKLTTLALVPTL